MKAILVLEMPKRCANCLLRCSVNGVQPFCTITFETLSDNEYYNTKPTWCPLKPMPSRFNEEHFNRYEDGYNACIDEILGDNE